MAPALGPIFGGIIIEFLNWHWIFIIMIPILVVSFVLGSTYIREITTTEKIPIDFLSVCLSAIVFGVIVYGFSTSGDLGWSNSRVFLSIAIGILSMVVFTYRQLHLEKPLIQVCVFKYTMFSDGVIMLMMTVLSIGFVLPMVLQKSLGCSSIIAALAMLPGAIINGIMSLFTGNFFDKHGPKILLSTGFILISITLFIFSFVNYNLVMLIFIYAIFMFGASMIGMPSQTNGLNQLPQKYNADGSAIMNTLQQVSGAIGTALASSILTNNSEVYLKQFSNITSYIVSQSVVFGSQKTCIIFLILSFIGIIIALFTKK